ncbi:hypothetical protein M569_00091 [Genlisea aurea]|uniref:Uncharacterized protein n=1 Tax=Genlisea aurea TaxID=192259 RepID=S8D5G8_9LAMI|nr:hypothetical protein M569_00091 [Genlisea aurea]
MTRLLDVMEEYLTWKQYRYLRLDGQTSGGNRGALIETFNKPDSPYFIFLLSPMLETSIACCYMICFGEREGRGDGARWSCHD